MAYEADFSSDDEDEENQGEQVLAGETSEVNNNQPGSQQNASANAPTKSGSWTNLMDYIGANAGEGGRMGGKISSGIGQRATDAKDSGSQFQQRANERVSSNTAMDSGIDEEIRQNPNQVLNDQQKRAQFDKQFQAYYGGPNDASEVEGYSDTGSKFNAVQDRAKTAQTHAGREALLSDEYNRPNYSKGEKQLDSFILGAEKQGTDSLADINQNYSDFNSGWGNLVNSVNQNIGRAKQTAQQTGANTRAAVNQGIQSREQTFADQQKLVDQQNAANTQKFSDLVGRYNRGETSAATELGIDPSVMGLTSPELAINNFLKQPTPRGLGDVASADEIANYQALLDLSGLNGNFNDFSRSGSDSYYDFDRTGFENTLARLRGEAKDDIEAQKKAATEEESTPTALTGGGKGRKLKEVNPPTLKEQEAAARKEAEKRKKQEEEARKNISSKVTPKAPKAPRGF